MKTTRKIYALITLVVALSAASLGAAGNPATPGNHIAGLWDAVATPFPNQPGPPLILTHTVLTRDGHMVVTNPQGSAVGGWQRAGGNSYHITFVEYFEPFEGLILQGTVDSTVELSADGQQFSGPFRTRVEVLMDMTGQAQGFEFEGTVEGNRVHVAGY